MWTGVYTTVCLLWLGCGGAQGGGDPYAETITKQRACCSQLGDPNERAACIDQIVTVDDEDVRGSAENRATFRCIEQNFVCDPSTGQATAASRQAQLDCINDIGQ